MTSGFGSNDPAEPASTTGLRPNVASSLAYLAGPLSGALVLIAERVNDRVRFHAWQSVIALGALWTIGLALYILAFASIFVSSGALIGLLFLAALVWIGSLVLTVICMLRAYRGLRWKLPWAGDRAERLAGKGRRRKEEG